MRTKIDLSPIIEQCNNDYSAIHYILKLLMKDVYNIPVVIDLTNIQDDSIQVEYGNLEYTYNIDLMETYFEFNYSS